MCNEKECQYKLELTGMINKGPSIMYLTKGDINTDR